MTLCIKSFFKKIFKTKKNQRKSPRIVALNFGEIGKVAGAIERLNHVKAYSADIGSEMPVVVIEANEFNINEAKFPKEYYFDGVFLTNKGHVMIGLTSYFKVFCRTENNELVRIIQDNKK